MKPDASSAMVNACYRIIQANGITAALESLCGLLIGVIEEAARQRGADVNGEVRIETIRTITISAAKEAAK